MASWIQRRRGGDFAHAPARSHFHEDPNQFHGWAADQLLMDESVEQPVNASGERIKVNAAISLRRPYVVNQRLLECSIDKSAPF